MKRNTITIQINFNNIIIYQDNEYKKYFLKHSINNYKIYNKEIFIEDFKNIIDKLKINNKLLTDNINIIIDSSYKEDDQILLKETFKELSFNKIKLVNNLTLINNKITEIDEGWDGLAQTAYSSMYQTMNESLVKFPELVDSLGQATVAAAKAYATVDQELQSSFNSAQ